MLGIERVTPWGYSLYEFEVYGADDTNVLPSAAASLELNFNEKNSFNFSWADVEDADFYQLFENADGTSDFVQVGADVGSGIEALDLIVPLHLRADAQYILKSCTTAGCLESALVSVNTSLANSITLIEPDFLDKDDWFGYPLELSADGSTLAIGSRFDDGVLGNQFSNNGFNTGAVFIFTRSGSNWFQQGYLKTRIGTRGINSFFGSTLSLTADGNTLVVGSLEEDSVAVGVNGDQFNSNAIGSGAAYVFRRSTTGVWSETSYLKASNTEAGDDFGSRVAISANGEKIAVSAVNEDSGSNGVNSDQNDNSSEKAGAVYIFDNNNGNWEQEAYLKPLSGKFNGDLAAPCCDLDLDFSSNGTVLAIGAASHENNGAVFVFINSNNTWNQDALIKPVDLNINDAFGQSVRLSGGGDLLAIGQPLNNNSRGSTYLYKNTASGWINSFVLTGFKNGENFGQNVELNEVGDLLVVAAPGEASSGTGINGNQFIGDFNNAGAAFIYRINNSQNIAEQLSFVKASNTNAGDFFGSSIAISSTGTTLAVGARLLDKNSTETNSGGVFIY